MTKQVMILKVKESRNSRFQEKKSARLFNNEEMQKLTELAAAAIMCGCDVKVELNEMEDLKKWKN